MDNPLIVLGVMLTTYALIGLGALLALSALAALLRTVARSIAGAIRRRAGLAVPLAQNGASPGCASGTKVLAAPRQSLSRRLLGRWPLQA